jgi:hypothetical protein
VDASTAYNKVLNLQYNIHLGSVKDTHRDSIIIVLMSHVEYTTNILQMSNTPKYAVSKAIQTVMLSPIHLLSAVKPRGSNSTEAADIGLTTDQAIKMANWQANIKVIPIMTPTLLFNLVRNILDL